MDFNLHSPTSSTTTSVATTGNDHNRNDPVHSWWESISKARSRVHQLSELLPNDDGDQISSLADTDNPASSLLHSSDAYLRISSAIHRPHSGTPQDPLCQWLYDTYQSQQNELQHVVLSHLPLVLSLYLLRMHHCHSGQSPSLAGFEAVLLAMYSSETNARNGKPVTVTIPDLSQPSLYHNPSIRPAKQGSGPISQNLSSTSKKNMIGVVANVLEPQVAVKSTKRACIVGTCLSCYYKHISYMPVWSKIDFCRFAADWAGKDCECASEFDKNDGGFGENNGEVEIESVEIEVENGGAVVENDDDDDERIPLPWELL